MSTDECWTPLSFSVTFGQFDILGIDDARVRIRGCNLLTNSPCAVANEPEATRYSVDYLAERVDALYEAFYLVTLDCSFDADPIVTPTKKRDCVAQ